MSQEKIEFILNVNLSVDAANEFYEKGKGFNFSEEDFENADAREREIMQMLNNLVESVGAALAVRGVLKE